MFPRVAFEYGRTWWAFSRRARAVAASRFGRVAEISTISPNAVAVPADADLRGDRRAGDVGLLLAGDAAEGALEAGAAPGGEELLRVGSAAADSGLLETQHRATA
jgi:hypothetical protein